jgi:aspartyl/asparaginyl-tRNA synthetase
MDYGEAIEVLERSNEKFEFSIHWGVDLQSEHERYLTEKYAKKPVIVINYPKAIKAFYMRLNDDGCTVAAMDVLAPGIGEIIGGSQRAVSLFPRVTSRAGDGYSAVHPVLTCFPLAGKTRAGKPASPTAAPA